MYAAVTGTGKNKSVYIMHNPIKKREWPNIFTGPIVNWVDWMLS